MDIFSIFESITNEWSHFSFGVALFVFCAYVVVDALYARYTIAVTALNPYKSANSAALIYFFIAIGVLNYTQNYLYVIPLVLGSWVGTFSYVSRMLNKRKE
jgi:hypothetical protein